MKILVLSDIHDHVRNLRAALADHNDIDAVICLGDLCSSFTLGLIMDSFQKKPVHLVFGNNDGDTFRITAKAHQTQYDVHIHGEFAELVEYNNKLVKRIDYENLFGDYEKRDEGGFRIAMHHFDNVAELLAKSGVYDIVFYGHNHIYNVEKKGKTFVANPGTIMGYDPAKHRDIPATYIVFDTVAKTLTSYIPELTKPFDFVKLESEITN